MDLRAGLTSLPQIKSRQLSKLPDLFGSTSSAQSYFVGEEIAVLCFSERRYQGSYLYPLLNQIKQKQRKCALFHQTSLSELSLQNLSLSCPLTAYLTLAAFYQIFYCLKRKLESLKGALPI